MKHKTSELSGALLDAAVALAEGFEFKITPYRVAAIQASRSCGLSLFAL